MTTTNTTKSATNNATKNPTKDTTKMNAARTITIERTFQASLDDAWDLWTTKDGFASWWGPKGFGVDVHELDPRAGGRVRYTMKAVAPEMIAFMKQSGMQASHEAGFTFAEVVPKTRIACLHVMDFIPGVATYESRQVVEFAVNGGAVTMRITLEAMHDEEWTERTVQGWTSQLAKLEKRFAT